MNLRGRSRNATTLLVLLSALAVSAAEPRLVELSLVGGKPAGGEVRTVRVSKDDKVVLRIRSDEAMAVHLHGYEVELRLVPGNAATTTLEARIVGRFPLTAHLHGKEPALLYLEVHPR